MAFYDGILDKTLQRLGYMKASQVPSSVAFAGEMPAGPVTGWEALTSEQVERLAVTSSWVFSDISSIASEASQAAFHVYEQGPETLTEVVDHSFEQLIQKPNPHMGKAFFIQYTLWWALLRGEAYWWLIRDQAGELTELWPIPAQRMQPIPDAKEYIAGFWYKPRHGRKPVAIPREQVFFYRRHPNPFDYHRGLSPLTAYRLALETDEGARKWNRDTFNNEATLRMLISLPKELSPTEFRKRQAEIIEEFVDKRKRLMVARGGDITAEQLGLSHDDLEFLAGREFTREEIDRVFGVPAGFWAKEATRANAEAAKATFIEQAVWPVLVGLAEEMTAQVVTRYYGEELRGQFEDIRPRDRRLLVDERRQYWQVKTVNEARADLDLDPLGDALLGETLVPLATRSQAEGPGLPGGQTGMMPLAVQSAEMKEDLRRWKSVALRMFRRGENPTGYEFESEWIPNDTWRFVMDGLSAADTEEAIKAVFDLAGDVKKNGGLTVKAGLSGAQKQRLARTFLRIADKWERRFSRAAGKQFQADKEALLAVVEEVTTRKQAVEWHNIERGWQEIFREAGEDWRKAFVPLMQGLTEAQSEAQALALGMEFDVRNLYAEEWFDNYTLQFAEQVMDTTGLTLNTLLQDAQVYGWSIGQLEEHLGLVFAQWMHGNLSPEDFAWFSERMPAWRRELIARTETIRSSNAGIHELYRQWGVAQKEWWATDDDRTCPWCLEMHKTVIAVGLPFWEQNSTMTVMVDDKPRTMTFNYEEVNSPPLHCNCRCCLLPVLD